MATIEDLKESLKNFDNYRWAVLFTLPIAIALLIFLIMTGAILLPEWFLDLFIVTDFVGGLLSGNTYLARIFDGLTIRQQNNEGTEQKNTYFLSTLFNRRAASNRPIGNWEKAGTIIGAALGIAAAVTLIVVVHTVLPFLKPLHAIISATLFTIRYVSTFAGLGNRLGCCTEDHRLPGEKAAMGIAAVIGLGVGIALFLTCSAALVGVAGVTTFFTGGAALPVWIAGAIFVTTFASQFAATADYTSKAGYFFKYCFEKNGEAEPDPESGLDSGQTSRVVQVVKPKFHEYRGAAVGIVVGLIVGAIILTALAILQPHIFVGIVGIAIGVAIFTSSTGLFGSVCSRTGRFLDGFKKKNDASIDSGAEKTLEKKPVNQPAPPAQDKSWYNKLFSYFKKNPAPEKSDQNDEFNKTPKPTPAKTKSPKNDWSHSMFGRSSNPKKKSANFIQDHLVGYSTKTPLRYSQ